MSKPTHSTGYEKRDVNVKVLLIIALIVALVVVIFSIGLYDYFITRIEKQIYESILQPGSSKLAQLNKREEAALTQYRAIDADKNVYQIPIEQAKALIVSEAKK